MKKLKKMRSTNKCEVERVCSECNGNQTSQNKLRSPFGSQWFICTECIQKQAKVLISLKEQRTQIYPQIQMILPGIYLGNEDAAIDKQTIEKYQIRAICVCGSYLLTPFKGKKMEGKFENIQYIIYNISDFYDQKIAHLFDNNTKWVDDRLAEGRNILFHCSAGVSRSATFLTAYLMKKQELLYPNALTFIKARRKVVNPNSGFRNELYEYGKNLYQEKYHPANLEEKYRKEIDKLIYGD